MSEFEDTYAHARPKDLVSRFPQACSEGNLEEVKYLVELLSSYNLDVGKVAESGLHWLCHEGHLEILKYLLTSPDLKSHPDIHVDNDICFSMACVSGRSNILSYLIFDYNIMETNAIKEYLKDNDEVEIMEWFKKQKLNAELEINLPLSERKTNKAKI